MNLRRSLLLAATGALATSAALADPPDASQPDDASVSDPAPAQPDPAPAPPVAAPAPAPAPPEPEVARAPRRRPARGDDAVLVAPTVDVAGVPPRPMERVPGSTTQVRREDLEQLAPQNAGDVLRTVPGVNVVSEDGMGLRLNIGIRGLDPNRSRQVLVLEDGVPITLNPYGAPELYYSPPIERMERVEVVRGSGGIMWGPQTVGGVINYITRDPPRTPSTGVELRYGNFGYFLARAFAGATHGAIGWRIDAMHRRFDGPRSLDLGLTDVAMRLRLQLSSRSLLNVKVNFYQEDSAATYLGLTTPQFNLNPAFNPANHDRFVVQRYAVALMHQHAFSGSLMLRTNLYAYQTDRVWRRQEFDRDGMGADYERACDPTQFCAAVGTAGLNATRDGGSLYFLRTAAIRDRTFGVMGLEPRLTWTWRSGEKFTGELNAAVRFHTENAQDQLRISNLLDVNAGVPVDAEFRSGYALSAAVQHRFGFWDRLFVTPGLRIESFWTHRDVTRASVTDAMGQTTVADVDIRGSAHTLAIIPALGVSVNATRSLSFFAGVHRGYAPPRTKDAVSPSGVNLQLDPELSWNTELGARLRVGRWLNAEVAGFWMEFENQIIPPNEISGGAPATGFNSGLSRHLGLESSVTFDLAPLVQRARQTFTLPLTVNYTWLPNASFVAGLYNGNRLPYAPEHTVYARLRFLHRSGFSAQVGATYVSSQFSDRDNTRFASTDGVVGVLPEYLTVDARVGYAMLSTGLTFFVAGRNLTDQVYIANRAPQGIQPAGFRQVFLGLEWNFPRPPQPRASR
ncbi:MAG: TonB-dependent receptor [Polyangiales bacterium]